VFCLPSCKNSQNTAENANESKSPVAQTMASPQATLTEPIATANPEENGWKNLRWGMSYDEIMENYRVEDNDDQIKKCAVFNSTVSPEAHFWNFRFGKEVEELYCSPYPIKTSNFASGGFGYRTGILMYKGRFFGKIVYVRYSNNEMELSALMGQLKEKYPRGKITKTPVNIVNSDYVKSFSYVSDDITVRWEGGSYSSVYIYNTKMLQEALKEPLAIENEEERLREERDKESKKPF